MTDRSLLERQARLLAYLTSGAAIFGGGTPHDASLRGFDRARLRLEARLSYEKRMEKILRIYPRTFVSLGEAANGIRRAFAEACPSQTVSGLDNAEQFCGFLRARRRCRPPIPPHVRDIAACELAMARVRNGRANAPPEPAGMTDRGPAIRRRPGVVLLRCTYDIRAVFEGGATAEVIRRNTRLVVHLPPGTDRPQVTEVPPAIYEILAALDRWTGPAIIGAADDPAGVFAMLAAHGLLDVRP